MSLSYKERQDRWVEENGIDPGVTRVKVAFKVPRDACGWPNQWRDDMDSYVGHTFVVKDVVYDICNLGVELGVGDYVFPYFCLENAVETVDEQRERLNSESVLPEVFDDGTEVLVSSISGIQSNKFPEVLILKIRDKNGERTSEYRSVGDIIGNRLCLLEQYRKALKWCSGIGDFQVGGKARDGWERVVKPLIGGSC